VTDDLLHSGAFSPDPSPRAATDLLGAPTTPQEQRILAVYEELKALCAEDLPPNAAANVRAALAPMHNAVNGLALTYEHLSDLGV
jgi:hypothetical protein